jgi:Tol biopolymer transport system component
MRLPSRFLTILLSALAATLILGVASAAAAPKEIAYRCDLDICLLDPDNPTAVVNLTDNGEASLDEKPVWSPDGKRLAFISRFSANTRNLFVMEPDAPGQSINVAVQVTHFADGGYLGEPVWSPDGTRIAFIRGVDEGSRSVLVANSDGTTLTPVTVAANGQHPTWAPDSGKIAYSYGKQVYVKNADGSGVAAPLANSLGREPTWSPDGSRIAFEVKEFGEFGIASANGLGVPTLVPNNSQWAFPSWSPDGGRIAYRVQNNNEGFIAIVNADGTGAHELIHVQEVNGYNYPASWSPDGSRLVYEGYHYAAPGKPFEIELENSNGTGSVTSLAEGFEPVWRPQPQFAPPVFTPAGGTPGPLPGPTQPPKRVWITKRVPYSEAPYVPMLSVGCSAPSCNVGGQGTAKGATYAGVRPRAGAEAAAAKPKSKSKGKAAKPVLVGKIVKTKILQGQTKTVKMKLTPAGVKLIKARGSLTIDVKLTIASPGLQTLVEDHKVTVFYKPAKKPKKGGKGS